MISLGVKTSGKDVTYALKVENNNKIIIHHLNIEPTLSIGKKLTLIKMDLKQFLTEHLGETGFVEHVHVKSVEMNAMSINPDRIMMNGVLLQILTEWGATTIESMNKSGIQKILKAIPEIAILFPDKKVKYDLLFGDKVIFNKFTSHFLPDYNFDACTNVNLREAGINCVIGTC